MNGPEGAIVTTESVAVPARGRVGAVVDQQATRLQTTAMRGVPASVAALARLRRGVGKQPGELLDILEFTLDHEFFAGRADGAASFNEYAAHIALTLFALHQQSKSQPMHRPGVGLGTALRRLGDGPDIPDPIKRRFRVLGTADSVAELTHHLRGAVQLLRAGDVGLDYGLLADQLVTWQLSGGPNRVRLRWGRDFYRTDRPSIADKS
jgi:CRISPR system Cascade subunit CasB